MFRGPLMDRFRDYDWQRVELKHPRGMTRTIMSVLGEPPPSRMYEGKNMIVFVSPLNIVVSYNNLKAQGLKIDWVVEGFRFRADGSEIGLLTIVGTGRRNGTYSTLRLMKRGIVENVY